MKKKTLENKTLQMFVLFGMAKLVFVLLGSLFFFNSKEAHGFIWPCLLMAMIGLAIFAAFQAWGKASDDPTLPTVVASLPDELNANAVVALLETHGITARPVGGYTSGFQTEIAGDVKVVVAASDAETAKAAIQTVAEGSN